MEETATKRLMEAARDGLFRESSFLIFLTPEAQVVYRRLARQMTDCCSMACINYAGMLEVEVESQSYHSPGVGTRQRNGDVVHRRGSPENSRLNQHRRVLHEALDKNLAKLWIELFENPKNRVDGWFNLMAA